MTDQRAIEILNLLRTFLINRKLCLDYSSEAIALDHAILRLKGYNPIECRWLSDGNW